MELLEIEDCALKAPENLCLCTADELFNACEVNSADTAVFGACLAELYVRWFVGRQDSDLENRLRELTPGGELPVPLVLAKTQDALRGGDGDELSALEGGRLWPVPASDTCGAEVERCVRTRILDLIERVDGYVPVYLTDGSNRAVFLPFRLVEKSRSRQAAVEDAAGKSVTAWNAAARQVLGSDWRMIVDYRPDFRPSCPPLSGRSFMLPLLVAKWTKEGQLPRIRPWRLLFTGILTRTGEARPVQVDEKAAAVERDFAADAWLVTPVDEPEKEELRRVDPIRADLRGEQLLKVVRSRVEAVTDCRFNRNYARSRLTSVAEEVRDQTVGEWARQIDRIRNMKRVLGKRSAPREHLLLLMLESEANCHCGQTARALALNKQARSLAERDGCVYEAFRLAIEELVELQDSERFDDIARLAAPLEIELETADGLSVEDRLDLQMRFYGTMGQIQIDGVLLGLRGFTREAAQTSLDRALDSARKLEKLAPGERVSDVLQDLNYQHLCLAFFEPGSEDERQCAEEMRDLCESLEDPCVREKNRAYQRRQLALAAFSSWRLEGRRPGKIDFVVPEGPCVEPWIAASTLKMRGALAAAAGCSEKARADFAKAEELLPLCKWWSEGADDVLFFGPVFAFIRLTILAQAVCSLAQAGLLEEMEKYRQLGHELVERVPLLRKRRFASQWIAALDRPVDPRLLPATYY